MIARSLVLVILVAFGLLAAKMSWNPEGSDGPQRLTESGESLDSPPCCAAPPREPEDCCEPPPDEPREPISADDVPEDGAAAPPDPEVAAR